MLDKSSEQLVGKAACEAFPENDECIGLLDRVVRTRYPESHTERECSGPRHVFWTYTIWPVIENERCTGTIIQVTETAQFHQTMLGLNEALLLGSVRQHELTTASKNLNEELQIEIMVRKKAEKDLLLLAAIIEFSDDAIISKDLNGNITSWNRGAERIFGYASSEILGTSFRRLIPTDRYEEEEHILARIRLGESIQHFETIGKAKNGGLVDISVTVSPVKDEAGNIIGISKVARNISARKQAEENLRMSERRFRALVTAGSEVVYRMNPDWSELQQLDGQKFVVDTEKPSGAWLQNYIHPDDQSQVMVAINEAVRTKSTFELEHRVRRIDGTFGWTFSRAVPLFDAKGEIIEWFGAASDITERKRSVEQIRQLNADLEQRVADRTAQLQGANDELGAFSYSVSHDLRAPLRHVLGYVNMLQRDAAPSLSEQNLALLNTIAKAATRMGTLIDDLLAFAHLGRTELRKAEVNLDRLVREVVSDFEAETKQRNIAWKIQPLPMVNADCALLRMVLVNLISNAVKFTGARAEPKIQIGCVPGGDTETVIFIRDNGAGFNSEHGSRLFGVFQRLHRQDEFEGTGIGLANVQRIIKRHGGRVWAEGAVDRGATFYFSLPKKPIGH
jgi:PAS domain S-box-containing protein